MFGRFFKFFNFLNFSQRMFTDINHLRNIFWDLYVTRVLEETEEEDPWLNIVEEAYKSNEGAKYPNHLPDIRVIQLMVLAQEFGILY